MVSLLLLLEWLATGLNIKPDPEPLTGLNIKP
jgi:hypothetical protein